MRSLELWHELDSTLDGSSFELEAKGGLVVAASAESLADLTALGHGSARGRRVGTADWDPRDLEPHLRPGLAGGVYYPQDLQVQPMLAAAQLLRAAVKHHGATVRTHTTVTALERSGAGAIAAVRTSAGVISTPAVVNAAGTWAGDIAALAGVSVPVRPRRGYILVTEPLPDLIRHKVYAAEYVANVASSASDLQTSAVVEGTRSGTVLIGASRERVGFDRSFSLPVLADWPRRRSTCSRSWGRCTPFARTTDSGRTRPTTCPSSAQTPGCRDCCTHAATKVPASGSPRPRVSSSLPPSPAHQLPSGRNRSGRTASVTR